MTAKSPRRPSLENVLDELSMLASPLTAEGLRDWTAEYPEFTREITAFVTDWIAMDSARLKESPSEESVNLVVNRTMSRVQALLDVDGGKSREPLTDLSAAIRVAGFEFGSFQRRIGIDRSILDCLVARLVRPASIPALLVRSMAEALVRPIEQVRAYLQLPATVAGAFKSRKRPAAVQVDFEMLVRSSALSDDEKDRWLRQPVDPDLQG